MPAAAARPQPSSKHPLRVVIVGAGFGGIAAAIELRRYGITDVTILEKAPDLGGTWLYNSYPGAACDVPSHLYSYSYAQRTDWSRLCSPQTEILAYLHDVARTMHVDQLIRTNVTVTSCTWNEECGSWRIDTAGDASYEAEALVIATGQLHQPSRPAIEGADTFAGHSFHSAEWDHEYPLAGKRVAVVGTGASAVQFVPEIAPEVERLTVFQRSANWFLPRKNRPYPRAVRTAVERVPGLQACRRGFVFLYTEALTMAIRHPRTLGRIAAWRAGVFMRSQLKDPDIRARAWPDYTFGCKRVLFSSLFLPALQRANVRLVTDTIARIEPHGVVSADDELHELDCIIWATGFKTTDFMFPLEIVGREGRSLREQWSGGAHAHLGITVPGFPSMFVMYGPNTNTSGGSILVYLETQATYIRQALLQMRARGAGAIEVRPEVEAASDRALQARFAGTAWTRCDSWYRDERGRIVTNWPGYMREYLAQTARLDAGEYRFAPAPARTAASGVDDNKGVAGVGELTTGASGAGGG
jgi:cation diffusion facilitator CzcD-associated flavoprotein CzcO